MISAGFICISLHPGRCDILRVPVIGLHIFNVVRKQHPRPNFIVRVHSHIFISFGLHSTPDIFLVLHQYHLSFEPIDLSLQLRNHHLFLLFFSTDVISKFIVLHSGHYFGEDDRSVELSFEVDGEVGHLIVFVLLVGEGYVIPAGHYFFPILEELSYSSNMRVIIIALII